MGAFFVAGSGAAPPYVFAVCEESWKKKELEKKTNSFFPQQRIWRFCFKTVKIAVRIQKKLWFL